MPEGAAGVVVEEITEEVVDFVVVLEVVTGAAPVHSTQYSLPETSAEQTAPGL